MRTFREKLSFTASFLIYLLFNLRISTDAATSLKATAWQIFSTAPYLIGCTIFIVAALQYMGGGKKLPWDRRLRIFFALGIFGGLLMGIYEYGGVTQ